MKTALLLSLTLLAHGALAQSAVPGLAPDRAARIDRLLDSYVEQNRIAGAVALVLRDGKPVYERAVGWSDKEAGRRMSTDTIFRIASQTKAITSAAIMALVEEGKIGLNEPVGHFIPSFTKTSVSIKEEAGVRTAAGAARHHDSGPVDPYRRHLIRHRATRGGAVCREGSGTGGRQRLVHRR